MNPPARTLWIAPVLLLCLTCVTRAHEARPGYLEFQEQDSGHWQVVWKVPMRGDLRLALYPRLPEPCQPVSEVTAVRTPGALVERLEVRADVAGVGDDAEVLDPWGEPVEGRPARELRRP